MDDLISRKDVIDALDAIESEVADGEGFRYAKWREFFCDLPPAQPEITRCKDCRHDHDCNIQYHAQAGEEFYCGAAERRTDEP